MADETLHKYKFAMATADSAVVTGAGRVAYVFIEGVTSGHYRLRDGTDATGTIIGEFKVAVGSTSFAWPMHFETGLFIDLVAGTTPTISVLYE